VTDDNMKGTVLHNTWHGMFDNEIITQIERHDNHRENIPSFGLGHRLSNQSVCTAKANVI